MIGETPIMLILLFLIEKNSLHNLMNAYKFCRVQSQMCWSQILKAID